MVFGVVSMVIFVVNWNIVGGLNKGIAKPIHITIQNGTFILGFEQWLGLVGLCLLTSIRSWGMPQMV